MTDQKQEIVRRLTPDRERSVGTADERFFTPKDARAPPTGWSYRQRQRWYHISMDKTTIYLPTELKSAIKRVARQRGVSEAEVIRDSIRDAVGDDRPRPRGGLFASRSPIAREAEEHLPGFGER